MSSLNISGRRIIDMETVEEMIKAVDDGDGQLEYDEFIQLLKKWKNVIGEYLKRNVASNTICIFVAFLPIVFNTFLGK